MFFSLAIAVLLSVWPAAEVAVGVDGDGGGGATVVVVVVVG